MTPHQAALLTHELKRIADVLESVPWDRIIVALGTH